MIFFNDVCIGLDDVDLCDLFLDDVGLGEVDVYFVDDDRDLIFFSELISY